MSYHKIEDIVEQSIVLTSEMDWSNTYKRSIIYNLFQFQNLFDCSYTHFRQLDILLNEQFTYRLPIKEHPDFETNPDYFKEIKENWITSDLSNELSEPVYIDPEDNSMYVDAGSSFWERLNSNGRYGSRPEVFKMEELVHLMLHASLRLKNDALFAAWYALLCEDIIEDNLLLLDVEHWFTNKTIIAIRELGSQKEVTMLFRQLKKQQIYPDFPNLAMFTKSEDKLLGFKGRFFLDFTIDLLKLEAQYQRFIKVQSLKEAAKAQIPEKLKQLQDELEDYTKERNWTYAGYLEDRMRTSYIWYQDLNGSPTTPSASYCRKFMMLIFDGEEETIRPIYAIQLGLILLWQKQPASLHPAHFHAYRDIIPFISEKQANDKNFNSFGLLKFPIQNTKAKLSQKIDFLKECLRTAEENYFNIIADMFPEKYFGLGLKQVLDLMENGIDNTGVIPEHIFIGSTISAKQLFAFWSAQHGNDKSLRKLFPNEISPAMPQLRSHFNVLKSETEKIFLREPQVLA